MFRFYEEADIFVEFSKEHSGKGRNFFFLSGVVPLKDAVSDWR